MRPRRDQGQRRRREEPVTRNVGPPRDSPVELGSTGPCRGVECVERDGVTDADDGGKIPTRRVGATGRPSTPEGTPRWWRWERVARGQPRGTPGRTPP